MTGFVPACSGHAYANTLLGMGRLCRDANSRDDNHKQVSSPKMGEHRATLAESPLQTPSPGAHRENTRGGSATVAVAWSARLHYNAPVRRSATAPATQADELDAQAAGWEVYGVADDVCVSPAKFRMRWFTVLLVFLRDPSLVKLGSIAAQSKTGLATIGSLTGHARTLLMRLARATIKRGQKSALASLLLLDQEEVLGHRKAYEVLDLVSPLHLDEARDGWRESCTRAKQLVTFLEKLVANGDPAPLKGWSSSRASAYGHLLRLLVRNVDRQPTRSEFARLKRRFLKTLMASPDGSFGKSVFDEVRPADFDERFLAVVRATARREAKVVPAQLISDRRSIQRVINMPMLECALNGLDLCREPAQDLVYQVLLLARRESPDIADSDGRSLEIAIRHMAHQIAALQASPTADPDLAGNAGEFLLRTAQLVPEVRARSWGVADFIRKAQLYFVYEKMRAGPRFWKDSRRAWRCVHGTSSQRPRVPHYRLCAYADFLVRHWWDIASSRHKPDRRRRCRTPIMTDNLRRTCCSVPCRKNLSIWRRRLNTT